MKKHLGILSAIVVMLCVGHFSASAQLKRFSLGPFVEAGFPTGDFQETNKRGFGVGLQADIKLVAGLGVTGSVGYMRFGGKTETNNGATVKYPALGAFPIRVGLRYHFIPLVFVKFESGAANFTGDYSGTAVILAPSVGVRLLGLEVSGKYEAWLKDGTRGFWGLKAGYNF
ncbi:outer membrane beta-barrel protein [Chitinophaga pendula]|uniref:outer membrane beta-barrel protein n=1 Tax=Chitinophaga TaxID=79328 RepID=UPI000BAEBFCB|nr:MULTISPECIES: outer membrane beta-barrel protein [Chitinophaga]ASZ13639.1 hypothetical protein CK934_23140 [Chitinophaga sp. MD30]UCJ08736.1 outer membrane beta-barrel protein [Chitinophaga pendula]